MKQFLIAAITSILVLSFAGYAQAAVEKKEVCKVVKGKKVCKMIKIHKKIEDATKVPEPVKPVKKAVVKKKKK